MKINKAQWDTDENNVKVTMPISKVDQEKRLVSGWASLDNIDSQGDVITSDANRKAFSRFRGNVREMHSNVAVGKMVDFKEDSYFDTSTEKMYSGIMTTVYVSKGAPDTWEKVLDGTLQGFSIGGSIVDDETKFDKAAGKAVRVIKDYELVELSLVDSPANQLANIFSIEKANGADVIKGMVSETDIHNVFMCEQDEIAKSSPEDTMKCINCDQDMKIISWFENDGTNRSEKIAESLNKYHENNKGGDDVAEEQSVEVTPEVVEVVEETVVVEEPAAEETPEVVVEEKVDLQKMMTELQEAISADVKVATDALSKTAGSLEAKASTLEEKIGDLDAKHAELVKRLDGLSTGLEDVEKSLGEVQAQTAVRKSGDLGGSTEGSVKKSMWGGRFLGVDSDL